MAYTSKINLFLIILIYGIIIGAILPILIIDFSWIGLGLLVSNSAIVSIPLFEIRYISLLSPQDEDTFAEALKSISPKIQVKTLEKKQLYQT